MSNSEIEEDFLTVDTRIPGQNYVCLSFVSPEKFLPLKEVFKATKFLQYVFNDKERKVQDMRTKMEESRNITYKYVEGLYKDWLLTRNQELEQDFYESCNFQTTKRTIKVRGVYDTVREANMRAKILQRKDPNFHVFVGQVGYWLPWDPACQDIENQEYQEGELNNLMKKYKENIENRDVLYEQMKDDRIKAAKEEVKKKREEKEKKVVKIDSEKTETKNINNLRTMLNEIDENLYETEQNKFRMTKEEDDKIKELEEIEVESEPINNFKSSNMSELEKEDPWLQRKKEQEQEQIME